MLKYSTAFSSFLRAACCQRRHFKVLAFESSADDTCVAVVTSSREILSNVVIKQTRELEEHGGIHPYVAIQAHQRNMPRAVQQALREARLNVQDVDGIAFTRGPGMGGCLSVSANAAKNLAAALGKPLVGVHHMQAHALTPLLTAEPHLAPTFPYLCLLISGGHTMLVLAHSPSSFEMLATGDLSIGNCFDKVAKLLSIPPHPDGLGLGAALERFCELNTVIESSHLQMVSGQQRLGLSVPSPRQLKFSYNGIHSELLKFVESNNSVRAPDSKGSRPHLDPELQIYAAHTFQRAAVAQLEEKLGLALDLLTKREVSIQHVVISGGVASNQYLRSRLHEYLSIRGRNISLVYPLANLCTDNAAMIGWASTYRFLVGNHDGYDIDLLPSWNIDTSY